MEIKNSSKTYYNTDHLVYSCQYHVIFCPKYRRKVLKEQHQIRLKEIFKVISSVGSVSLETVKKTH